MRKSLIFLALSLGLVSASYAAETAVSYNCQFKVNKDKFSKAQHQKIDAFIAAREKATVAKLVRSLGGTKADVIESVAAVSQATSYFAIDKKIANLKNAKFTVSGNCNVNYKAKQAFGVDVVRDRAFSKMLTHLSHRDILAIEDYIADLAAYRTPVDRDVSVNTDLSYV